MVICENTALRGCVDELIVCGGADAHFSGTVDGDIVVKDCSTLRFDGVLLGTVRIEDGSHVEIDGVMCEDNLPDCADYTLRARLIPSGYAIVKRLD